MEKDAGVMTLAELESFLNQPPERLKALRVVLPGQKSVPGAFRDVRLFQWPIYESPSRRLYLKAFPFEQQAVLYEGDACYEYHSYRLENFLIYLRQLGAYLAREEPAALAGLRRFCHTELARAHRSYILWECTQLSRGTISKLTGLHDHADQERLLQELIAFVGRNWDSSWHSWIDAWNAYRRRCKEESTLEL